jgi:hypothetical protein
MVVFVCEDCKLYHEIDSSLPLRSMLKGQDQCLRRKAKKLLDVDMSLECMLTYKFIGLPLS